MGSLFGDDTPQDTVSPEAASEGAAGTKEAAASRLHVWTDGSCLTNPGPGGWGLVIIDGSSITEHSGGDSATTNNRMEIEAVLQAIQLTSGAITVHSDSTYVIDGATKWMTGWKAKGWGRGKNGNQALENKELWQEMDRLLQDRDVAFEWVKAHAGHVYNERADVLALEAAHKAARAPKISPTPVEQPPLMVDQPPVTPPPAVAATTAPPIDMASPAVVLEATPPVAETPPSDAAEATRSVAEITLSFVSFNDPSTWRADVMGDEDEPLQLNGGTKRGALSLLALSASVAVLEATAGPMTMRVPMGYIAHGATNLLPVWREAGWRKKDGNPLAYAQHWQRLEELMVDRDVEWVSTDPRDLVAKSVFTSTSGITVFLDTETTGLADDAELIEIGAVAVNSAQQRVGEFHQYFMPEGDIDPGATEVHQLTKDILAERGAVRFHEKIDEVIAFLSGHLVVAHNASFDIGKLQFEIKKVMGANAVQLRDICAIEDTLLIARRKHPGANNRLDALAERYKVGGRASEVHDALGDVDVLIRVYYRLMGNRDLSLENKQSDEANGPIGPVSVSTVSAPAAAWERHDAMMDGMGSSR